MNKRGEVVVVRGCDSRGCGCRWPVMGSGGWWSLKVVAVVLAAAGVAVEGDGDVNGGVKGMTMMSGGRVWGRWGDEVAEEPLVAGVWVAGEAKRLKSALRKVASVGLYVQQSTSSGRQGYRTYKSLPVLTEALSYQSSSTTAVSYLIARLLFYQKGVIAPFFI
ncbi:hypothetical protein Tco_1151246 [Tanacetum coccineum]